MHKKTPIKILLNTGMLVMAFQILFVIAASGQTNTDRLEELLKETSSAERVKVLTELIEELHRNDTEKAIKYVGESKKLLNEKLPIELTIKVWFWAAKAHLAHGDLDSTEMSINRSKILAEANDFPEARADALLLQGDLFRKRSAYEEAFTLYEKSYKIYDSLQIKRGMTKSLSGTGQIHELKGNYTDALSYQMRALGISKQLDDKQLTADIHHLIGIVFWGLEDGGNFLFHNKQALSLREELRDIQGIGRSLNNIAVYYAGQGEYEEALSYYERSLSIKEEHGNKKGIASSLVNIGSVLSTQGDYEKAISNYNRAYKMFEELKNDQNAAIALTRIGGIYIALGEYDKALPYHKRSLSIKEEIGDKRGIAISLEHIGRVLEKRGDFDEALSYHIRSLAIREELNYKRGIAISLDNIGGIYSKIGDFDEALPYYNRSLIISEELGTKSTIATSIHNIGCIYEDTGDFDQALPYFTRSLAIFEELDYKKGIATSLTSLVHVQVELENYEQAIILNNRSMTIFEEIGDKEGIISAYLWLSQIKRLQNYLDQALDLSAQALLLSDSIGALPKIRFAHEERTLIFEQMGQYDSALYSHRAFKAAHDSLFSTDGQSVIAELQQQYKTKEQKQRIELLEQDRQLKQLWLFGLIFGLVFIAAIAVLIYNRYRLKKRANKLIQSKSDQLEKSHAELKSLSEFKQGMTGMIAHDIKNPLNSIIGISERMEEKGSDKIVQASRMILQLVTNMLDVEKYEHNTPSIKVKKVLLSELITEAKLSVELLIHDKSIQLKTDFEHDYQLEVDPDMMVRVFINLLSNAIKFAPSHTEISILASHQKSTLRLSFIDQGKGIHQDDLPNVFKKFWQSDARHSGVASSTGLGLSFCKMAVMAHDGIIYAESEYEKGSTFIIELPIPKQNIHAPVKPKKEKLVHRSNQEDNKYLRPYANRLKTLKVHQVSSIMSILDEIEELNLDATWLEKVKSAVIYSNKEEYEKLLRIIE